MIAGEPRYSWGADEHLWVEISEEMSLEACFAAMGVVKQLREQQIPGVLDVCPANASYQVRFDPDVLAPADLLAAARDATAAIARARDATLATRIVEIPVLYDDPWTRETLMRFRDRHQDRDATDLEFAARINGFADVDAFIRAHSGAVWLASMVGFVAGLPFLYQMVPRAQQLEVPKYLRPRTDTPALTVGHGGCFGAIYSVRGAGGYQMFGITPSPIYDPEQVLPDFRDFVCFFEPGDLVRFTPIDRSTYDGLRAQADAGTISIRTTPVVFDIDAFDADPAAYNQRLLELSDDD